ncbi:unnamed protein product [Hydatigera taeniaeformis]|uniref:Late endosomal/lysosomal adaptor and MAPK and MTOR activator 5 n=1 Tax=Hydatigena taeniaeformis TaxID=6205 RepID=A0A0R3XA90_HYDTA|nr:unnamed protein product [Hydatigera taeniaeformis]
MPTSSLPSAGCDALDALVRVVQHDGKLSSTTACGQTSGVLLIPVAVRRDDDDDDDAVSSSHLLLPPRLSSSRLVSLVIHVVVIVSLSRLPLIPSLLPFFIPPFAPTPLRETHTRSQAVLHHPTYGE